MYYRKLRGALTERGLHQYDLANYLHLAPGALSLRFTAQRPWDMAEAYSVMDYLGLPYEKLHEYFPRGGRTPVTGEVVSFPARREA